MPQAQTLVHSPKKSSLLQNVPLVQSEVQPSKQPEIKAPHIIKDQVDVSENIMVFPGAFKVVALTKDQL